MLSKTSTMYVHLIFYYLLIQAIKIHVCLCKFCPERSHIEHYSVSAIVFVYDFFPGAETVLLKHFSGPGGMNGYNSSFNMEGGGGGGSSRSYNSGNKGRLLFKLNLIKISPLSCSSFVFVARERI